MKQFFGLFALAATLVLGSAFVAISALTYNVDLEKSTVNWKGYKVTGSHEGTIDIKSGGLEYTDGLLTGGTFEIDMTTITTTDLKGGAAQKLIGHLNSEDFFGVEKYPTAKLVITNVSPQGPGRYKVTADLTIKETTKAIKFTTTTTEADGMITAKADIQVDRSEYNVKYGSGTFFGNLGDKTIYDEFDLSVNLVASK
ncbi:MAG: YceI family protein [Bacteroidota bacterium]